MDRAACPRTSPGGSVLANPVSGDSLILWKLNEPAAGVLPSDFRETLPDLNAPAAVSRPAVDLGGVTGFGRVFAGAEHLETVDTGALVKLTRSVTIQFIVTFDLTAQDSAGVPGTLLSLGFRDSTAEDLQFLVELTAVDEPTKRGNIRMRWEDTSGVLESANTGVDLIFPTTPGGAVRPLLLTVVREWRSETEVIVRYYANDLFLGKDNSIQGVVGGAAGATILMGVRGDGAGGYENILEGTIEATAVFDRVMTAEEVRQIARLLTVHGPAGYELTKALVPEGVWSTAPDSIVQRELFVEGQLTGSVLSKAAELLEDFLPDRAWSFLPDWERILRLPPNPGDTVAVRRNRLLSFLMANEGHTVEGVKNALTATFDLLASQIEILEFTETLEDGFASQIADFWQQEPGSGTITNPSGKLRVTVTGAQHQWAPVAGAHAPYLKANIDRDERDVDAGTDAELSVLIDSDSLATDDETLAGIALYDQVTNDLVIWGLYATGGGTVTLGEVQIAAGVQATIVSHGVAPARPFHLNLKYTGSGVCELGTATAADRNTVTVVSTTTAPSDPAFVLLGLFGLVATGASTPDSLDFDDFRLFTPGGLRVFSWYAFRDLSLPGTPDIPGAQALLDRIKPAHTLAGAVTNKAVLADDPDSLLDIGPLG